MPTESPPSAEPVTDALASQDVILHVLAKGAARISILLGLSSWGADSSWLRPLALCCLAVDLARGARMRSQLPRLKPRWAVDGSDALFWALAGPAGAPYTGAVVLAVPALVATVVQRGWRAGALASTAMAGLLVLSRLMFDKESYPLDTLLFCLIALVLGGLLRHIVRLEAARQDILGRMLLEAELSAAALAGRNDVVTGVGADTIDRLQVAVMGLTAAGVDSAIALRAMVALHKGKLADETRQLAAYLRDALDDFARSTRIDQPQVARHVFFDVTGTDGTVVLSPAQAALLHTRLSGLELRGEQPVRVLHVRPDGAVRLSVGPHETVLARPDNPMRFGFLPVGTIALGLYFLTLSDPVYAGLPLTSTVPLALVMGLLGLVEWLMLDRIGARSEAWLALSGLLPFSWFVAHTAGTSRFSTETGVPLLGALAGMGFLLGIVTEPAAAAWTARGVFAVCTLPVALLPRTPPVVVLLAELTWAYAAYLGSHLLTRAMRRLGRDMSRGWAGERDRLTSAARRAGARVEISYLKQVLAESEALAGAAADGPVKESVIAELNRLRTVLSGA